MRFCKSPKGCRWPVFSTDKLTGKGYCRSCATKYRTDLDRRSIIQKAMAKQKSVSTKIRSLQNTPANVALLEEKGIVKSQDLELFYRLRRQEMKGVCQEGNCKNSTNTDHDKYFRWSICHIVPKSLVKSVATNENNWIELCMEHHGDFDNTFERTSKMMCFIEAKRKFQLFKDLIPPEELRRVNPYLLT